jgi:XTP/dITP diphosphohydrolase
MDLIIATSNPHKFREMRALLQPLKQFDLYSLLDFPHYTQPIEGETSFEENAILKAVHAAAALNRWALADDSGLVVPALKGAPGVISAYYAGPKASDKENRQKLLKEMASLKGIERAAYFECTIAIAAPDGLRKVVSAKCEGVIITEERGRYGFGYDPLFVKYDYRLTFAELTEEVKNQISHRAKAMKKLKAYLESLEPF